MKPLFPIALLTGLFALPATANVTFISTGGATPTPTPATQRYLTFVDGIDASGRILGHFYGTTYYQGAFTWKDGVTTDLSPAGARSSQAYLISPSGWIAGGYHDATGRKHIFSWHEGTFLDYPLPIGARVSRVRSIDDSGRILAGYWATLSNTSYSEERTVIAKDGTLEEITPAGGFTSTVVATNASGRLAGNYVNAQRQYHGFTWKDGVFTDLRPAPADGSSVVAMNDAGQIIGRGATYTNGVGYTYEAGFTWKDGVLTELPLRDAVGNRTYERSSVRAINASGQIVGSVYDRVTDFYGSVPAVWRDGALTTLPLPAGASQGTANQISDRGQVAGTFYAAPADRFSWPFKHVFSWTDGVFSDIPVNIMSGYGQGDLVDLIDSSGRIYGHYMAPSYATQIFTWADGVLEKVPANSIYSELIVIQPSGRILGSFANPGTEAHPYNGPFIWKDGVFTDLNSTRIRQIYATAMNSSSQPVGSFYNSYGQQRALTWRGSQAVDISPRGVSSARAVLINDSGQIAGVFTDDVYGGNEYASNGYAFFRDRDGTTTVVLPPFAPNPNLRPQPTPTPDSTPEPSPTPRLGDHTRPRLEIYGPTRLTTRLASLTLAGRASDNQKVAGVEVSQNGGAYRLQPGITKYFLQPCNLEPGENSFRLRAVDAAGNRSKPVRIFITRR